MGKISPFHVRIVNPVHVVDTIDILYEHSNASSQEILDIALDRMLSLGSRASAEEQLNCGRALRLIERRRNVLTKDGRVALEILWANRNLFFEIMHWLYYSTWDAQSPEDNCFSWSYSTVCNMLWNMSPVSIDKKQLAGDVASRALSAFNTEKVSFGQDSIGGVLSWLDMLDPPVIKQNDQDLTFIRRQFCSPELFVLAVGYVYRADSIAYCTNLLLNENKREAICRICLLDPKGFDRVMDYALSQFEYLEKGVGGGWGSYLVLKRQPELQDFLMR